MIDRLGRVSPPLWAQRLISLACAATLLALLGSSPVQAQILERSNYFRAEAVGQANGEILVRTTISGPPSPPLGYDRPLAPRSAQRSATVNVLPDVPAFTWCFGCSATSAAMIAGYYDRTGYPNMYTGPTNGGVMPLNNDTYWSTWVDPGGDYRNRCPLSATQQGLDGRTTRGHVDDYWIVYGNGGPDPYIGNWPEHAKGDCTGDYMGTNQSADPMNNTDGSTTFWSFNSGAVLTASMLHGYGPDYYEDSGMYGLKTFFESRGYEVAEAYNQFIYGYPGTTTGFTFEQYMAEIDAGHPVMVQLQGHTIVGVGYDSSTRTIYIHDTWDHETHTMPWGGSYEGMGHYMVTIVTLATPPEQTNFPIAGILLLL